MRTFALKRWVSLWTVEELYKCRAVWTLSNPWRSLKKSDFASRAEESMNRRQNLVLQLGAPRTRRPSTTSLGCRVPSFISSEYFPMAQSRLSVQVRIVLSVDFRILLIRDWSEVDMSMRILNVFSLPLVGFTNSLNCFRKNSTSS